MQRFSFAVDSQGRLTDLSQAGAHVLDGHLRINQNQMSWLKPFRPTACDLLRLATAVHHVDRLAPRNAGVKREVQKSYGWQRELSLEVAVAEPWRWNQVRPALERVLAQLTDDRWRLSFVTAEGSLPQQADFFPEREEGAQEVALFSGGLDSVAGLFVRHLEQRQPIYVFSSMGTSVRERFLKDALERLSAHGVRHRWIRFHHQLVNGDAKEKTQRTRGFLFFCAAAVVADALGLEQVATFECGVGALNLPMNGAQIGAQNTHAMHPLTLLSLERILEPILDRPMRLVAPFLLSTKGELCTRAGGAIGALALASNSCDETERNKRDTREHCGVCTSCLLRRSALHSALGADDPTPYRKRATKRNGQYEIDAFKAQADRFSALGSYRDLLGDSPHVRWAVQYLERHGGATSGKAEAEAQLLSLLHRHATEVKNFYAEQQPRSDPKPKRVATALEKNYALLGPNW